MSLFFFFVFNVMGTVTGQVWWKSLQINGTVNGENSNFSDEELTVADLPERLNVLPAASN